MNAVDRVAVARVMGVVSGLAAKRAGQWADAVVLIRDEAGGRADLLGVAAGTYRAMLGDPASWWADDAMRLCVEAGADLTVARAEADAVAERLRQAPGGPAAASMHR